MRILVVEDEKRLAGTLADLLHRQGYTVDVSNDGVSGLDNALSGIYDLVVLDVMLPGMDGFELLRRLRGEGKTTPVLMLTARSGVADRVQGLDCGADYYLTKPFESEELLACVRLLLRRAGGQARPQSERGHLLTVGGMTLDTEQRAAIRDGKVIDLTAKEYDLIELLMKNPRRVYSRESLMDLVWGYSYAGDYRTVDVHIRRLREKLEPVPAQPAYIMTKWGVGYYFKGESQPAD